MQCVASVPTCGTFPGLPRSLEEGEKVQTVPNVARPSQQRKSSLSLGPVLLSALLPFKSWGARLGRRAGGRSQVPLHGATSRTFQKVLHILRAHQFPKERLSR